MKKILSLIAVIMAVCLCVTAQEAKTVCANHILVESEADAIKLKNNIKNFDEFQYYAKAHSICPSGRDGGALGCFRREQMVKPFEDAAFNGEVGKVIGPVQTQFGYHLIWVTKKY